MSEMYAEEIERRLTAEVAELTLEVRRLEALTRETEITTLSSVDRQLRCNACGHVRTEPRPHEHVPVRRRLTLAVADENGGGTTSQSGVTCATCFPVDLTVPVGVDPWITAEPREVAE